MSEFIEKLSEDLKPFKPAKPVWFRSLTLVFIAIFLCLGYPAYFGFRFDIMEKITEFSFLLEVFSLIFTIVFTSIAISYVNIPGVRTSKYLFITSTLPYLIWGLTAFFGLSSNLDASVLGLSHFTISSCFVDILWFAILPLAIVVFTIRSGAPTLLLITGLLAGVYSVSVASLAQELYCGYSDPWHIVSQHFFPIALSAVLGTILGRLVFRW